MRPERLPLLFLAALCTQAAAAGFEANGVALGASEKAVREHFPNAHCQPLQWKSRAADRRCDDSRIRLAGIEARITVYLKDDAVRALDVRFAGRETARFVKLASTALGAPAEKSGEKARTFSWRAGDERALLTAPRGERRASLLVWRGDFYDEIYRVR